jgi:general secretion pathway protein C
MRKISNSTLISIFKKLLILLLVAKSISLGILWYLPNSGVEISAKKSYQPKYQRVNFKNMISKAQAVKKKNVKENSVDIGISITSMVLKGLYGIKSKGFIIVAMRSNLRKTTILGIGENFQGYVLKSISTSSALLTKDGADFILTLEGTKKTNKLINKKIDNTVARTDISYYAKNPNQIWKDISISEVKDGKNIKGFKVTKISKNSKFASLGLKKGDVITKANNVILKSYKDALEIYENIDKLDVIQIVIMRNNKEVELVYEIN